MHYSDRILELQAICLSSLPAEWRPAIKEYVEKMEPDDVGVLIACLDRQVRRETKLLAAKKSVLTILKNPKPTTRKPVTGN